MARDKTIKILRTTKANLDTQKNASGLLAGEPYFVTDEDRIAIGTAVNNYSEMAKKNAEVKSYTWVIDNPATGGIPGPRLKVAHTVTRLDSYVTAATSVTFNIEERSTIGSAGTDILASDQVADTDGAIASSFSNAGLAADCWLWLDISAVSGTPGKVVITLSCTV